MKAQIRKSVEAKLAKLNKTNKTARNLLEEYARKGFLSKRERKILDRLVAKMTQAA